MNVFSIFIPDKFVTFDNNDPAWITAYLKDKIKCSNNIYTDYLKNGKGV